MINKKLIILLSLLCCINICYAQIVVDNPSFEGISQPHIVPDPWNECFGSPDTQPGQWGFTQPASDGNSYISFLHQGDTTGSFGFYYLEGVSQPLSNCLQAGVNYQFTIDIAHSDVYETADPVDCYGTVAIWGGASDCDTAQLLWQSGIITNTDWQTVVVSFTPTGNWCNLVIAPYFITPCTGYINAMIDNMSPITEAGAAIIIADPINADTTGCTYLITGTTTQAASSVVLTGDILPSPVNATMIDTSNWQVQVTMSGNSSGIATIIATGNFANNEQAFDTVTVTVECPFDIPDVFTPDGDGINDWFTVVSGTTTEYEMIIYNRWGSPVFKSTDQTKLWDGRTKSGAPCADGVYYYVFKGKQGGKELEKHGTVTLLRSN